MASPSKRQHPWKTILRLESFEQRDLPSTTHALLNPLHTLSHSLGLTAIQSKVDGPWDLAAAVRTGTGQGQQQSQSAPTTTTGVDGQGQVTSTMSTDQGNTTSVTTDSASNTDTTSTGTVVNSDTTANNAQDNLTTNSSTTVSTVATGATPTDGSTTAALTVSVDSQTTQSVQIDGTTSVTVDQNQSSGGQSQTGDSRGTDQGNTNSNGNNSTGGSSDQGTTDSNGGTTDQGNTSTTVDGADQGNTISAAGNSDTTSSTSTSDGSSAAVSSQSTLTEGTAQQIDAQSTDGSSTASQSQASSTEYLPTGTTSAATTAGHVASVRSEQPSALVSSTYNTADSSNRISTVDTANRANSVVHNMTAASPHAPTGDAAMATSQDASHGRMDDMPNAGHQPLASAALVGRSQVAESFAGLDHTDHGITQQVGLVEAAPVVDGKSTMMAAGHQASSADVPPIDLLMAAAARTAAENPEAAEFSVTVLDQENTLSHPAHSLSHLLNIALSGDVVSLTDDFNQFFDKLEQVLNDPESLLSRFHPLSEAIAVGVAATAITAVHRRLKQNSRGRALQGWAGRAFDGYPGLGGPWVMAES